LIRFITHDIKLRCEDFQKVVSISLPKSNAPAGINPGVYAFYVKLWCFSGIKDEEILDSAISPLGSNKIICGDDAHAIINAVRVNGCDWQFTHGKYVSKAFIDKLDDCDRKISERFHELRLQKQNENTDRITMQIDAIDRYLNERRESYEKVLYKHREAGRASLIKALEGKIAKLQARMETQKEMLRGKEKILPSETTVCMGVINIT
jgi:hypothetical protein